MATSDLYFAGVVPPAASSAPRRRNAARDGRKTYAPAEIPAAFQTGRRRFEAERPATIEAQRRREQSGNGFAAEPSSYFPKIRESQTARDSRDPRSKVASHLVYMDTAVSKQRLLPRRSRTSPGNDSALTPTARASRTTRVVPQDYPGSPSIVMNLDPSSMTALHEAFERCGQLSEEEFISEMLDRLEAHTLPRAERVALTCEISTMFHKADTCSQRSLTWVDFSSYITRNTDIRTVDEDSTASKYQVETAPSPLNMTAEVVGMIYFTEVDRILFHNTKHRGFSILDPSTNAIAKEPARWSSGQLVDALYSSFGRYVVTASTSPVISLYDIDSLTLRQQIPAQTAQLTLASHDDAASTALYSACTNGQVHAWRLDTLDRTHSFFDKGHPVVNDLLVIDGMSQVASACLDGKIYMIDLHLHRVTKALAGHKKSVSMLRYNAENGYLVSAGLDHCVQVWNPHVEQKIATLTGHRSQLIGMEVVPNTHQIITADDSGLVKIWDLRKFAAVQTIAKELYVKDHSIARNLSRAMRSMCYIASKKRIAVAHSMVFFIDQAQPTGGDADQANDTRAVNSIDDEEDDGEVDEAKKPIAIFYCPPTQCFVALTSWEMKSWNVNTGALVRTASPIIGSEMTCACVVDDFFSCFVGTESGVVARAMIPNGSVLVQKRVHSSEVTATRWLEEKKQVASSAANGSIVVARYDTLEVVFKLNHWRGVQSASSSFFTTPVSSGDEQASEYSVPLSLRAYFYGNEIERLMRIFGQVDGARCGSIPLAQLPFVLEAAFPTTFGDRKGDAFRAEVRAVPSDPETETITFASLLEILKDSLSALHESGTSSAISSVAALDVHSQLPLLVSGSSSDGTFCVWNAKNGAVLAQGTIGDAASRDTSSLPSISQIVFLDPLPYFACIEAGSCSLEIWSTAALPPLLPHSFERLMRFRHTLPARFHTNTESDSDPTSRSVFITETEAARPERPEMDELPASKLRETAKETAILAIQWCSHDASLLCVADDQGYITVYDFGSVVARVTTVTHRSRVSHTSGDANNECPPLGEAFSELPKLHQCVSSLRSPANKV